MGAAGTPGPAAAGSDATTGSAGAPAAGSGATGDEFEAERIACVETINMYRATLSLPPLARASRELEACSDMGAKKDGDANAPHSSAGDCRPLGAQNTCPGYPARNGDVTASLNQCLMQMWAEGEPPNGVDACIMDRSGCFQMHGHWINMQSATSKQVACGFYKMANGRYWMNQNFGR
jgi:hypothetical protein